MTKQMHAQEIGSLDSLDKDEPRVLAVAVKDLKTGSILVPSLLVFALASLATLYEVVGNATGKPPARLLTCAGALLPRDQNIQVRALHMNHHDTVLCTGTLPTQHTGAPPPTTECALRRCARCDGDLRQHAHQKRPSASAEHTDHFDVPRFALSVCHTCVSTCPAPLRIRLIPARHDAIVREGVCSTCRPDLCWSPFSQPFSHERAWLTSRYGPYPDAAHLLAHDRARGAVACAAPDGAGIVWLWPAPT